MASKPTSCSHDLLSLGHNPLEIKNICESRISHDELLKIVLAYKDNVSPGNDGLPVEFYKKFWYLFGHTFTKIINDNFDQKDELSKSQKESIIRLICKDEKNKDDIKYYRPISLLN